MIRDECWLSLAIDRKNQPASGGKSAGLLRGFSERTMRQRGTRDDRSRRLQEISSVHDLPLGAEMG